MKENKAFVMKSDLNTYPTPPFHPGEQFPELDAVEVDKGNRVYGLVRETLFGLGMDREKFGTGEWNPFKNLVRPGDKVVLKPNLVIDFHEAGRDGASAMVTHASVLRPIIDYVLKASGASALITICDAPLQSASWDKLIRENHYIELVEYYGKKGINIELLDLRLQAAYCNKYGAIYRTERLRGDPKGNRAVDLGEDSCFAPIAEDSERLEITGYPPGSVCQHHNHEKNEYLIPRTVLECDVFISLPKMKTHKKAGVTLSLKNLIGINADKSWIAHHRRGSIREGGDEFDALPLWFRIRSRTIGYLSQTESGVLLLTWLLSPVKRWASGVRRFLVRSLTVVQSPDGDSRGGGVPHIVTEGSWYRNDTVWRTIIDMNRCLLFSDKEGRLQKEKQRRYFTLIDGILGMEGEGPMEGVGRNGGCLVAAYDPVVSDYVTACIMGVDPDKIPSIRECFNLKTYKWFDFRAEDIKVDSNYPLFKDVVRLKWKDSLKFHLPRSWQGHVEREGYCSELEERQRRKSGESDRVYI